MWTTYKCLCNHFLLCVLLISYATSKQKETGLHTKNANLRRKLEINYALQKPRFARNAYNPNNMENSYENNTNSNNRQNNKNITEFNKLYDADRNITLNNNSENSTTDMAVIRVEISDAKDITSKNSEKFNTLLINPDNDTKMDTTTYKDTTAIKVSPTYRSSNHSKAENSNYGVPNAQETDNLHELASNDIVPQNHFSTETSTQFSNVIAQLPNNVPSTQIGPPTQIRPQTQISPTDEVQNLSHNNSSFNDNSSNGVPTTFSNIIPGDSVIPDLPPAPPVILKSKKVTEFPPNVSESFDTLLDKRDKLNEIFVTSPSKALHSNANDNFSSGDSSVRNVVLTKQKPTETEDVKSKEATNFRASLDISNALVPSRSFPGSNEKASVKDKMNKSLDETVLQISLSSNGDSMEVSWMFASNDSRITGFQVSYRINKRENFDSSNLGIEVRSFTLHNLHEDEVYIICVHAMVNNTMVKDACAEWSKSSLKIVNGILAGVIFLIPCILVVIWILYKDGRLKKKGRILEGNDFGAVSEEKLISNIKTKHSHYHPVEDSGKEQLTIAIVAHSNKSLDKPLHDTGHENPCDNAADDDSTNDDEANGPWKRLSKQEPEMKAPNVQPSPSSSISNRNIKDHILDIQNPRNSNDKPSHLQHINLVDKTSSQKNIQCLSYHQLPQTL